MEGRGEQVGLETGVREDERPRGVSLKGEGKPTGRGGAEKEERRSLEPEARDGGAVNMGSGGLRDFPGAPSRRGESRGDGEAGQEEGVVTDPVLKALGKGGKEVERSSWAMGGGEQGKVGQVVPGGGSYPRVLGLGTLGAHESRGIGDTKSSDGADVQEEGVVNVLWHESMAEILVKRGGFRNGDGARSTERKGVMLGVEWRGSSLDEQGMARPPGIETGDGEGDARSTDGGGLEPKEGRPRLSVVVGRIVLELVGEEVAVKAEFIQLREQGDGSEGGFGGDDE